LSIDKDCLERKESLSRWFEPFVIQWLNENDDISMEYLHNAVEKDRQTGVNMNLLKKICKRKRSFC
jgi:hypothetical protein